MQTGDPVVRVYAIPSGDLVATPTQTGEATDVAFSPDGKYLATTGRRNGYVWDTTTWSQLHLLVGHEAAINDVAFSSDDRIATSSIDTSVRVWDAATGATVETLVGQSQQKMLAVAFSPDGGQLAAAGADNVIRIWNAQGAIPRQLVGDTDSVTRVSYSPDGSLLLSASADGTARLWTTTLPTLAPLGSHPAAVSTVAYSKDGKTGPQRGSRRNRATVERGRRARADADAGWRCHGCDVHLRRAERPHRRPGRDGEALERDGRDAAGDVPARSAGARRRLRAGRRRRHGRRRRQRQGVDVHGPAAVDGGARLSGCRAHGREGRNGGERRRRRNRQALARSRRRRAAPSAGPHRRDHVARLRPEGRPPRERQQRSHRPHLEREHRRARPHVVRPPAGHHVGRVQPGRQAPRRRERRRRRLALERGHRRLSPRSCDSTSRP